MSFFLISTGFGYRYGGGVLGDLLNSPVFAVALSIIIGIMLAFFTLGTAIGVVMYILRSLGLYRLSLNRGMSGAGLAWIPIVGFYRIGSVADDISIANGVKSYYRYILLIGGIINTVSSFVQNTIYFPVLLRFFNDPSSFIYFHGGRYKYQVFTSIHAAILVVSIAVFVMTVIALNKIYKSYRPVTSTSWTVLSVIFPFMQSIFLFIIRNCAPASGWNMRAGYPVQNQDWQAPPQYPPYELQYPAGGGYAAPHFGQGRPPQYVASPPPADTACNPSAAPNPPGFREIEDSFLHPPAQASREKNDTDL